MYVIFVSELFSLFLFDLPLQVTLVADQDKTQFLDFRVFDDLLHPVADFHKRLMVRDVVYDNDAIDISKVVGRNILPFLLSCRVPNCITSDVLCKFTCLSGIFIITFLFSMPMVVTLLS